jgi:predicted NBD/HSP70 family sugar kinase
MMASSRAALRTFQQLSPRTVVHNVSELFSMADKGNRAAIAALARQAKALGQGLRLITAALSPELILITGDVTASWDRFGPIVNKALKDSMLAGDPPRLQISADGDRARLSGAAAMLMQRHVEYYKSNKRLPKWKQKRQDGARRKKSIHA